MASPVRWVMTRAVISPGFARKVQRDWEENVVHGDGIEPPTNWV